MADDKNPTAPDPKPETPADRIAAKIRGLKVQALPEVRAADVLALAGAVADEKQTEVTLALARGAAEAVAGLPAHLAAVKTCHPQAGDLVKLLELARGNAQ